ncbi:MAG: hypothetical protein BWY46_00768 [Firmicutes bacterium ADurb.Bin300]|nr:MAG: hypothetical protein BWY46_00768 [Firmicutes bacterium ADurb.Bin300]
MRRSTSAPTEQSPALIEASSIWEEALVSIPIKTFGFFDVCSVSTIAAALPICIASSQVSSLLAIPLAPSVPNNLPIFDSLFILQIILKSARYHLQGM